MTSPLDRHMATAREAIGSFRQTCLPSDRNHPMLKTVALLASIAQALADLEAATEARVRRDCADDLEKLIEQGEASGKYLGKATLRTFISYLRVQAQLDALKEADRG